MIRTPIGICIIAGLLGLAVVSSATAAEPRVRVGDPAALTRGASVAGRVRAGQEMRLTIGMASRDPLGLKAFSQAVSTPGSPQYGRFLSVRQFARRFGAGEPALTRVRLALHDAGLKILSTANDHLSILVEGSARTIERAFATRLARVRTADGRSEVIDTAAPTLPASFGHDVEAVLGLNGLADPQPAPTTDRAPTPLNIHTTNSTTSAQTRTHAAAHPRSATATATPTPCAAATHAAAQLAAGQGSVASFGYTANAIEAAYDAPPLYAHGDLGQGETVAVYEEESLNPADIAAYQACYGTHASLRIHNVDTPDPVDAGAGGDGEAALDVEQVISVAPRASILVYAAAESDQDGNGALLSAIASQDAARIVTISYGSCEAELGRAVIEYEAKLFEEMAAQGQSVFASSGDQGAESCSPPDGDSSTALTVSDPASQPTVTAVGGTSLYSGSAADPVPWNGTEPLTEGIWNSGSFQFHGETVGQATAGGLSSMWAMPRFQSSSAPALGVVGPYATTGDCGSPTCREVPDVSADGDPSTGAVTYAATGTGGSGGSSWSVAGGTSVSAPLWAGFMALTDAQASCRGLSIGDANPALYALAGTDYAAYFRDVDSPSPFTGDTTNDATGAHPSLYPIGTGYDLATGLGAPLVGNLAPALCDVRAPVYTVAVTNPGTLRLRVHTRASVKIDATDSGGVRLTYAARGLPARLLIHARTGRITGRPTRPGRYRVTVSATDFASNRGRARFTLVVRGRPSAARGRASRSSASRSPRDRPASGSRRAAPG